MINNAINNEVVMTGSMRGIEGAAVSAYKLAGLTVDQIIHAAPIGQRAKDVLNRIVKIFKQVVDIVKKAGVDFSNIFRKVRLLSGIQGVLGSISTLAKWCKKVSPSLFRTVALAKQAQQVWRQFRFKERIMKGVSPSPERASIKRACENILQEETKHLDRYSGFKAEAIRGHVTSIMEKLSSLNEQDKIDGTEQGKELVEKMKVHAGTMVNTGLLSLIKEVGNSILPILGVVSPALVPVAKGFLQYLE